MSAKRAPVVSSLYPYAAVISLDPAGKADCGLAIRLTHGLGTAKRGRLRFPDYAFEGWAFSTRMHDELATFLAEKVGKDQRVLLVVEDSIYGARTTARSIGRGIGAIESVLCDLNLADPNDTQYVFPGHWRKATLPTNPKPEGRDAWKQAAIDAVATQYGENVGDNLAEAVLINDYTIFEKKIWWAEGKKSKRAKNPEAA